MRIHWRSMARPRDLRYLAGRFGSIFKEIMTVMMRPIMAKVSMILTMLGKL